MSKVAVVYTSTTGNTEKMAEADAIAFGSPAMGVEQLEESTFEPMFADVEGSLAGKKVGLFGSYGWGDGEWMRTWQDRVAADGAVLVQDGVMANYEPDDGALAQCKALGEALA